MQRARPRLPGQRTVSTQTHRDRGRPSPCAGQPRVAEQQSPKNSSEGQLTVFACSRLDRKSLRPGPARGGGREKELADVGVALTD
jgi:hypothetical protein